MAVLMLGTLAASHNEPVVFVRIHPDETEW